MGGRVGGGGGRGGGGYVSQCLNTIVAHCSSARLDHVLRLLVNFFSTGLVRGILSGVAVDVGSDIAKQSDPSNGSQKSKPMTLLNVRSLLFYIQFLNPITILLYTIKIYIYILNILLFFKSDLLLLIKTFA